MVLKKRCDFCLKIKQDNLQINEKVLNREFKDVLLTISGVKVSPEQLANILTCCECAILILQAEPTVLKVRNLLTKLSKSKIKKKPSIAEGVDTTNVSTTLEQSVLIDSDGALKSGESEEAKPPAKIKHRRKTIATTELCDSMVIGFPTASSTMALNENSTAKKPKAKGTADKKAKPKAKNGEAKPSVTNPENPENCEKTESETTKFVQPETLKEKILEREKINEAVTSPKKNEKSPQKRTISHTSRESNEAVNAFKKFKETNEQKDDAQNADITGSQDSLAGGILRECLDCSKTFRSLEKYERHVLSQKCRLANYSCKDPNCSRRYFKLEKMLEHMQNKHPEIQINDMD